MDGDKKIVPVVLDCDPGNDDAYAIIALLKCEEKFNFKLKAITSCFGNTSIENASKNILLVLKTFDRLDIPVHVGAKTNLLRKTDFKPTFHGEDGFGNCYKEKPSEDLLQKKPAVEALKDIIEENANEIVVIAIGPLTNIALLFKTYPDISLKIKTLYIMGGNHLGRGNITPCAEFNFWNDPEAAYCVLLESLCKVYICTWETCLEASKATPFEEWRLGVLASNNNPITKFMDPAEFNCRVYGNWIPCDSYCVACFIFPEMIKKLEPHHVTVELAGNFTRGQMVLNHLKDKTPNANIITEIDTEMFKKFMLRLCDHPVADFAF